VSLHPALPPPRPRAPAQRAAVAADWLLGAAWTATAYVRRVPELARAAREVESALARWDERGWTRSPERAHAAPPPIVKPAIGATLLRGGGGVEHLRFASEYEPLDPEIAAAFHARAANRTAHALLWRHRTGPPRPALVILHGFGMGRFATDVPWLKLRGLDVVALHRDLGIDVAYLLLPFHGPRAGAAASGTGFFDVHPLVAGAALGQAVWDARRVIGWLRAQGAPAVGIQGLSLGGCVAALVASLDASLASAVAMCPAVDLATIFWRQLPVSRRREWEAAGLGHDRLAAAWSLHAPLLHRARVAHRGRLLVGATADRIATADGVEALWRHWEEPKLRWLRGGHLVWLGGSTLPRALHDHFRATLLGDPPSARARGLSRFALRDARQG
jgi:hypothetical protein